MGQDSPRALPQVLDGFLGDDPDGRVDHAPRSRPGRSSGEDGDRVAPAVGVLDHADLVADLAEQPAALDAGDRWTVLPAPPEQVRRVVVDAWMVWTGQGVLIASRQLEVAAPKAPTAILAGRYDPEGGRWTEIAPLPLRPSGPLTFAWAGAAVVALYKGVVYDPAADRWLRLPAAPAQANSPRRSWGVERALLRTREHATGAVQVYVLVPARPAARP